MDEIKQLKKNQFEARVELVIGDSRTLVLDVEHRRGSYPGRYELYVDETHIGWVVKCDEDWLDYEDRGWHAFVSLSQLGPYATSEVRCAVVGRNRREAVEEIVLKLSQHARVNVLATRIEALES